MEVIVQPSSEFAANLAAEIIGRELHANPRLVLGLATGCTMEAVYARLIQMHREEKLDFSSCRTFNLDEYVGLSGENPNSYRYYMNHHLFLHVNIDMKNTYLPDGMAADLSAECEKYERLIKECGGIDFQILGIGKNGHIGFNEPLSAFRSRTRTQALSTVTREQNAALFPKPDEVPHSAITMGVETILDCRRCVLLATGEEKAAIVSQAIEGPMTSTISASALQLHSECTVILDRQSGSKLKNHYHWMTNGWKKPEKTFDWHDSLYFTANQESRGNDRDGTPGERCAKEI
jgi:glucosamine-6-phosphate deaminase